MKRVFAIITVIALSPAMSLAEGHDLFSNKFFSTITSEEMMEGKTGHIHHATNDSLWDWTDAPDGWPKANSAKCHLSNVLSDEKKPLFGVWFCESIDPDGDVSLWSGSWNVAKKISTGHLVGGTGKYANAGPRKCNLKTLVRISDTQKLHECVAIN